MSISEDVTAAENWVKEACFMLGLQTDIKVTKIVNKWRWTLEYDQDPNKPEFSSNMIKLEKALQVGLKRPIDLRLGAIKDKNKRFDRNYLRGVEKL